MKKYKINISRMLYLIFVRILRHILKITSKANLSLPFIMQSPFDLSMTIYNAQECARRFFLAPSFDI